MWSVNSLNYVVDDQNLGRVAIDVLTRLGYDIPRFCYHENLKIAGNCRMCLIEDSKAPKPIICCAMNISSNLAVFTNTVRVKKARESVMEFLLINHPLDCPICDQGGECDLQDLSLVYGSDHGRFYEYKRNVEDKNCGVIVKTVMNRCILCTRCVRYSIDLMGFNDFGITGRGSKMEIGSYIEKIIDSEFSGNLVDICPVGALTSKPYSFLARPWELKKINVINIFDDWAQSIAAYTKENSIVRITPHKNDLFINTWITNKIRFSYEGLKRSRISSLSVNNIQVSWSYFLDNFQFSILNLLDFIKNLNLNFLSSFLFDISDLNSVLNLKNLTWSLGSSYFKSILFSNNNVLPPISSLYFESNVSTPINLILIGLNLEWDAPILNVLLRTVDYLNILVLWHSEANFKDIDKFSLGTSKLALLFYLSGKHWLSSLLGTNASNKVFFNTKINFLNLNFSNNFIYVPVSNFGLSYKTLSVSAVAPTNSQNIGLMSHGSFLVTNSINKLSNSIIKLNQNSHNSNIKFNKMFVVPIKTIFEQELVFYDSKYSVIKSPVVVTTNLFFKSAHKIVSAVTTLLGLNVNQNSFFSYDDNTHFRNSFLKFSNFSLFFFIKNNFVKSNKLTYILDNNVVTKNSLVLALSLKNSNLDNIYK